jgi:hypothetical protein
VSEDSGLLGYDTVFSGEWFLVFQRNVLIFRGMKSLTFEDEGTVFL